MGNGSALEALRDDALYKTRTLLFYFTDRHEAYSAASLREQSYLQRKLTKFEEFLQ